jgi:alpha-L-rhamnosidase
MSNLSISKMTVEHMTAPVGLDVKAPRFAWVLENSAQQNIVQAAYQLQIFSEHTSVADTGRVSAADSIEVKIPGFEAAPKTAYQVQLRVWDNEGNEAAAETGFETGFLGTGWEASWYEPEQVPTEPSVDYDGEGTNVEATVEVVEEKERDFAEFRPAQYIRIPVQVGKKLTKARTYMTSHGVYRFYVNGSRPDDREFAPDNTAYQGFLQYQTYDITPYLKEGKNILGITVGDGWWVGRVGLTGDSCQYGTTLGLILQTELFYEDGTKEVVTGADGVSATGALVFSDIFVGEKYDATKELVGWEKADYDDSSWKKLNPVSYGTENLSGQYGEPVRPIKVFKPISIIKTPKGETVLDVGQVMAGQIEATITAEAGREIKFEHSEVLDADGNYYNNILGINKEQTDIYVTKEGTQTYRPIFSYHGFRYVKISGWNGEPSVDDFTVYVLSSQMDDIGTFTTSNEKLNQLQHNIYWSQISNTLSIPTDCPQRERAGWTGDIMAFSPTLCFNRNADAFLTRWMKSLRIDQRPDGAVTDVVPYLRAYELMNKASGFHTSCGWGDAVILVPLAAYRAYGDKQILADNYDAMVKWMDYIKGRCENNHPEGYESWDEAHKARSRYLWNTDFHFGDWLVPSMVLGNPDGGAMINTALATKEYVAPAYYAFSAKNMKAVAEALGKTEDAKAFGELYENIKKAYIEEYVSDEGRIPQELQGLYVIALKNDLVSEEARPKMAAHLREMIEQNDNCLDTGFLSVLFLMDVLCENGMRDLAYKILYQTKCPSWLYEVEHGATTMWESWGAVLEDGTVSTYSYNHYAFGCVGEWMYKTLGGLKLLEPGYKRFAVSPDYDCGLSNASVSQDSPYGNIEVSWKKENSSVELNVKVPVNTTAEIALENGNTVTVGSGSYRYVIAI